MVHFRQRCCRHQDVDRVVFVCSFVSVVGFCCVAIFIFVGNGVCRFVVIVNVGCSYNVGVNRIVVAIVDVI